MPIGPTRRTAAGITALAAVLLVTACGSGDGNGDSGEGAAAEGKAPEDINIAFIGADGSQNFVREMLAGAEAAGEEFGVDVQLLAPTSLDGPAQVRMFEDAMRSATDGIAVESLTPDLLVRAQARAAQQDIPVISVDTPPLEGSEVTAYIGNDNAEAGALLADEAIRLLEEAGTTQGTAVVASPIPGIPTLDNRAEGMAAAFAESLPDFEVVGPVASAPDPTGNYGAWSNLVAANRDATVFMDAGDAALASLAQLNREAGGTYLTGAFDLNEAGLQAIADGTNFATVDPQHFLKGYLSTRILIEAAMGEREIFEGWWVSSAALVTQENVAETQERQESSEAKLEFYRDEIDAELADPPLRPFPGSD
ncbi:MULTISPECIES: sugar ABC transporter substrate-binding protein [unclassified Modestobacter]|uniref:sugar ABC transporter substrate-binding protein n=1 Tax=unclassified Modestobacter TaxID=2643866 RepID=UPI0022AB0930|nr:MULTISPECIES: sugar ABC transporter substrate-binding protein [unclassified Modestobacter]MCZ2824234.1 sugar ABC transporter substrate-binding protein [Modestobacter sp. VKM Ac-2981]MCZ2854238.1 sugar ABC transporter substrate-binding protein [Modestobacter sp. VKM Ac-2982]